MSVFASGCHSNAAATGRYAGRNAADYAVGVGELSIDRKQIEVEKARVYAPLQRQDGVEWKELRLGLVKIMQDYCYGDGPENKELLKIGLRWLDELEASEAATACARNPHELMRLLEVFNKMTFSRMILEAYLTPQTRDKWVTFRLDEGETKVGELPFDYYGDLRENYEAHCGL
jgi:succinate dehydrogenase/fumarate reductase flavoprotein subunit